MANSFIDPALVRMTLPEGPGWEWNPGQTFVTAFNNAQENKRLQQKRAEEAELAAILLPAKRAEAEFSIKKLAYDSQLLEKIYRTKSAALDESYRGITSAIGGSGASGDVVSQDQQPQQQMGYSNRLRKTGTGAGTLGSGLQPIQPVGGN